MIPMQKKLPDPRPNRTGAMAHYFSLPVLAEVIKEVETGSMHSFDNSARALANAVLNHYFPATEGWIVAPGPRNSTAPDLLVLRTKQPSQTHRFMIDHTVAGVSKKMTDFDIALNQLEGALEVSTIEYGRCWAVLFHGADVLFYKYQQYLPKGQRMVPAGPPSQPKKHIFQVGSDGVQIHQMLTWMSRHDIPSPTTQFAKRVVCNGGGK
ncbi:hypothetical protein N7466_009705 [Penicillium verhagenii]|uniref:uncharacterized protein n=1 Tax=Penicillium verhagenii TaxID=1562060 RepID=UPI0025453BA9|nr:uncharacterized protein N7466_009705 [Penicillium verhagenii]KAJ5921379.1 hypothetical protein N7466_009705 [Penicillium verhagenii]